MRSAEPTQSVKYTKPLSVPNALTQQLCAATILVTLQLTFVSFRVSKLGRYLRQRVHGR